jgi:hypothetical protein
MSDVKYRIAWKSKLTGHSGCGEPIFSLVEAEMFCDVYNKIVPNTSN